MSRYRKRRLAIGAGAVLGIVLSLLSAPGAQASIVTNPCSADLVFVGVRGTDAPAGSSPGANGKVWLSGGFGDQVKPLRDKFAAMGQHMNVYTASVNYPASGGVAYFTSMMAGRDFLGGFLNEVAACPVRPMVVLAGHSQGADVIANTLSAGFVTASAKSMVNAAVMYGDPMYQRNKNYVVNPPSSGGGVLGARGSALEAVLEGSTYYKWGWPYQAVLMGWYSKIRSWCFTGDWACTGVPYNDTSNAKHNSYKNTAQEAFDWALYMTANTN